MINTILNVDNICQDCPYFSTETDHLTNCDGIHMIYISCEHRELCNRLRKHIEKEMNTDNGIAEQKEKSKKQLSF